MSWQPDGWLEGARWLPSPNFGERPAGEPVSLSPTEFTLLRYFVINAGTVLSKPTTSACHPTSLEPTGSRIFSSIGWMLRSTPIFRRFPECRSRPIFTFGAMAVSSSSSVATNGRGMLASLAGARARTAMTTRSGSNWRARIRSRLQPSSTQPCGACSMPCVRATRLPPSPATAISRRDARPIQGRFSIGQRCNCAIQNCAYRPKYLLSRSTASASRSTPVV